MADPKQTTFEAVTLLLRRKNIETDVALESVLAELGLESLDLAELSAILEDELGKDPYSAGTLPVTVGDIVAWYHT